MEKDNGFTEFFTKKNALFPNIVLTFVLLFQKIILLYLLGFK